MARLNPKTTKIPAEFDDFLIDLTKQASVQTGMAPNKTATLRRMGTQLRGRLITKGLGFDWVIINLKKKRK